MSTLRERAEELAAALDDLARVQRAEADTARAREIEAFHDCAEPPRGSAQALYYVAKGAAVAYEAAALNVKLLAAGIPEGM